MADNFSPGYADVPVTAVFIYIGLTITPAVALIDVFFDFPRGDQDWTIYLMYWPIIMLFCAFLGLLADGFERFLPGKNRRGGL